MSYLRKARSISGRAGGPGMGALGATEVVTLTPAEQLFQQVNRFAGPGVDAAHRFKDAPLASGKTVTPELAVTAMVIVITSLTEAWDQFGGGQTLMDLNRYNAGLADAVSFVSSNMAEVTTKVAGYAQSLGLPGPNMQVTSTLPPGVFAKIQRMPASAQVALAGGAVALFLLARRAAR